MITCQVRADDWCHVKLNPDEEFKMILEPQLKNRQYNGQGTEESKGPLVPSPQSGTLSDLSDEV